PRFRILLFVCAINGFANLGTAGAASPAPELAREVVALERAVNDLASPSSDPRKVLNGVVRNLPRSRSGVIEASLTEFIGRMPAAGVGFRCDTAFVRDRARKELLRVKDVLLDANPQMPHPEFCSSSPIAIDIAEPMKPIDVYGYDFDREPIQVLLMNDYGFRDVTSAAEVRSHSHLNIDLEKHALKLSSENRRIAISVGHLIRYSIPIIQADTRLCASRIEQIEAGRTVSYEPPPIEQGKVVNKGPARFWANASLDVDSNVLELTLCLTAAADDPTHSSVSGCAVEYVYTSDADRTIERVFGERQSAMRSVHDAETRLTRRTGTQPVTEWVIEPSSPAMSPKITAKLGAIRVVSTEVGNCMTPLAFEQAKRAGSLGPATVRRLDAELRAIDPRR
ncbi:MAG TPA: hypothetical protein VFP91_03990, partial [Vicinamibacterales bacterium]|nr:hypothetical protein [Vicinamibacterales bacterium]